MSQSPLWSAFLKLKRAEFHRKTLECQAIEFFGHEPERVVAKPNKKGVGGMKWGPALQTELPVDWPGIAGDCLQNLRSALDHIIWACALRFSAKPPTNISFAIRKSPEAWSTYAAMRSGKDTRKAIGDDARKILHDVQPYHDRNVPLEHEPLWMLNELASLDRHQSLHLSVVAPSATRMSREPLPLRGNVVLDRDSRPDWPRFATPVFDDPELAGSLKINDVPIRAYPQVVFVLCLSPNEFISRPVVLIENLEMIESDLRKVVLPQFQNVFRKL